MSKTINTISSNGVVTFNEITKDGRETTTSGTKADCDCYGYKFIGTKCYAFQKFVKRKTKNIGSIGIDNEIKGSNNITIGSGNNIQKGRDNFIIGHNNRSINNGETIIGTSNQAFLSRVVRLQTSGTTSDATETELFLNGIEPNRYYIDTNYECAIMIIYTAVALNESSNEVWAVNGVATFKYVNSTLSLLQQRDFITQRDSNLDYAFALSAQTSPNVHIASKVTGEAAHDVKWNINLELTEVYNG